ncbi:hypothetical protein BsWGS_04432 [Bradybaena similaris]
MDNSLNGLFSVILHSEKAALDEKQKCREVKDKIESLRQRLERQTESRIECAEKIERLTDGLFHSSLGTKLMKSKEEFLIKQLTMIQDLLKVNTEKMERLNSSHEESLKDFMMLVRQFSSDYSISSNRRETKDAETRTAIKTLRALVESLSHELQELQSKDNAFSEAISELQEVSQLRNILENQRKECEQQIEREKCEIMELQEQHHQLEDAPRTDESFVVLNRELERYQTADLEKKAKDLQKELNQLVRTAKQKEDQRQKQQYRQWQRQRQQMLLQEKQE